MRYSKRSWNMTQIFIMDQALKDLTLPANSSQKYFNDAAYYEYHGTLRGEDTTKNPLGTVGPYSLMMTMENKMHSVRQKLDLVPTQVNMTFIMSDTKPRNPRVATTDKRG